MTTPVTIERTCENCGQQFSYEKARTAGRQRKWCSTRCANRAVYLRRAGTVVDVGPVSGTCEHCGHDYTYTKTTGVRRKYCGERCKMNAGADRAAERRRTAVRECACGSPDVPKVGKSVCKSCRKTDRDRTAGNRKRRFSYYGITEAQFDEILVGQRGCCAVCGTDDPGERQWMIDHDHKCCPGIGSCGQCIRGIVCYYCNFMLGNSRDNPQILLAGAKYLQVNATRIHGLKVVTPSQT